MADWSIDSMNPATDLDGVIAVEQASFSNPWTRAMYLSELRRPDVSFCDVARDGGGRVIGFCAYWRVLDEMHINNLAVAPDWRRRGVAAALIAHAIARGQQHGVRAMTLEVRRSNAAALALYARFGFEVGGVRPRYYTGPDEDALILWRRQ